MLCFIARACKVFFVFQPHLIPLGGEPDLHPNERQCCWWLWARWSVLLREAINISVALIYDLYRSTTMIRAELAMPEDKQADHARNGQERQLRGLNEKLEQTLTEKRDAEHFRWFLAPKYKSVFVVDLKTVAYARRDRPDYFQKILNTSGGSFLAVCKQAPMQAQPATAKKSGTAGSAISAARSYRRHRGEHL